MTPPTMREIVEAFELAHDYWLSRYSLAHDTRPDVRALCIEFDLRRSRLVALLQAGAACRLALEDAVHPIKSAGPCTVFDAALRAARGEDGD